MANRSSSGKTWLIVIVLVAAAAGGAWYVLRPHDTAPEYQTAAAGRGDLIQVVTATGQLNPVTNVTVGSQISGIIDRLFADFNSRVTNGQIIALLDPATYKAAVQQAEGDLASARASLELAQVQARRSEELFRNQLVSASDNDTAIATLHQAEATVKIKDASLSNAQVNLDRCTIYSPVDGIVISRSVDVGQTVAASLSAPTIFVIANDLARMQIDANVAEADVGGVVEGQDVDFTVDAFPFRTFHGKVSQVRNSPIVVQNVVTYDTVITVRNDELILRPGMTANVSIIIARHDNALKIPNAALRFRPPDAGDSRTNAPPRLAEAGRPGGGGGPGGPGGPGRGGGNRPRGERQLIRTVYVLTRETNPNGVETAQLKPAQIKTGISDGIATEVLDGLKEGELVVTGVVLPDSASARPVNPFGGGRRF